MADAIQAPASAGASTSHTQNQAQRLSPYQLRMLHGGIHPNRVQKLRGLAHLEAWDVRRQLLRIFGFGGYSIETLSLDLVHNHHEDNFRKKNKQGEPYGAPYTAWTIVYRAQIRLTVFDVNGREICHWEDGAAGDAINQPSVGDAHDMAMKTALSQALKRCAVNLGDQFGLSLYNDASRDAVVNFSAAHPPEQWQKVQAPLPEPDDPPVQPEPKQQAGSEEPAPQAEPPAQRPQAVRPQSTTEAESPDAALDKLMAQTRDHWGNPLVLAQVQGEAKAKNLTVKQVQGPDGQWVKFGDLLNGRLAELAAERNEQQGAA